MTQPLSPSSCNDRSRRSAFGLGSSLGRARAWLRARLPAIQFVSQAEEDRRLEELQRLR